MGLRETIGVAAIIDRPAEQTTGFRRRIATLWRRQAPLVSELDAIRLGPVPRRVSRIDRWFPPRQILVRGPGQTVSVNLSQRLQLTAVSILSAGVLGFVAATLTAAWNHDVAGRMSREMDDLRSNARLEAQRAAEDRELLHRLGEELSQELARRDDPAAGGKTLAERQAAVTRLIAEREAAIEHALAERARVAAERDKAIAERDAALATNRDTVARIDEQTRKTIADVEKIINATGLDAGHLMQLPAREDRAAPRGGPFVPVSRSATRDADQKSVETAAVGLDRLQRLRDVLEHVPLSSPVAQIDISSLFGVRHDPMTGRAAMHEGIDLRGSAGEPIRATAAGTVLVAGWGGDYGQMVEVDHGLGLVTRYAHLRKILVKPGDSIAPHQVIGLMGASGRATGVHLHYEVNVNGRVRDPLNFLKANHHVPEKEFAGPGNGGGEDSD